jgi:hypothetical protein
MRQIRSVQNQSAVTGHYEIGAAAGARRRSIALLVSLDRVSSTRLGGT